MSDRTFWILTALVFLFMTSIVVASGDLTLLAYPISMVIALIVRHRMIRRPR